MCVYSLINSGLMAHFKNKLKPLVQTELISNTCMMQIGSM